MDRKNRTCADFGKRKCKNKSWCTYNTISETCEDRHADPELVVDREPSLPVANTEATEPKLPEVDATAAEPEQAEVDAGAALPEMVEADAETAVAELAEVEAETAASELADVDAEAAEPLQVQGRKILANKTARTPQKRYLRS